MVRGGSGPLGVSTPDEKNRTGLKCKHSHINATQCNSHKDIDKRATMKLEIRKKSPRSKKNSRQQTIPPSKHGEMQENNRNALSLPLIRYDELPRWVREVQASPYILTGYRPVGMYSVKDCFLSIFRLHNETINIWSHLIGTGVFFWLLIVFAVSSARNSAGDTGTNVEGRNILYQSSHYDQENMPAAGSTNTRLGNSSNKGQIWSRFLGGPLVLASPKPSPAVVLSGSENAENVDVHQHEDHTAVHYIFIFLAICQIYCMASSVVYHTCHCKSEGMYRLTMLCDYVGISVAVTASFVPIIFFAFNCHPFRQMLYLGLIFVLGLISVIVPFFSFFDDPQYLMLRVAIYVSLVASGVLPTADFGVAVVGYTEAFREGCPISQTIILTVLLSIMAYSLGVTLYALKIPERWAPGKFDLWCNSHQLWHIFVVLAGILHVTSCFNLYHRKLIRPCGSD